MLYRYRLLMLTACSALALPDAWGGADTPEITLLRHQIEQATLTRDLDRLQETRQALLDQAAADPGSRSSVYAAYASFRQGVLSEDDKKRAGIYIDQCVNELRVYVRTRPGDAEAQAMLASCYGISTRYHRLTTVRRGLSARRHMDIARELEPGNPWILMQDALVDYSTPRLFGGDQVLAVSKLERATQLFDAAVAAGSEFAPWGAAEAWLQLEKMYRETGRPADALAAMDMACRELPDSGDGPCPLRPL